MVMSRNSSGRTAVRFLCWIVSVALFTVLSSTTVGHATATITVSGSHGLAFGSMTRSSSSTVTYSSGSAAVFTVTGSKNNGVYIAVSVSSTELTTSSGSSSSSTYRSMDPSITTTSCKYSTNNGSTWNSFTSTTTGYVYVATTFPNSTGSTSSILVRVGATLTSGARQQRGSYSGTVTVGAQYD